MHPVDPAEAVPEPGADGFACAFTFVAEPPITTPETGGGGQFPDQGRPLVDEFSGACAATDFLRLNDLIRQLVESTAVLCLGLLVQHRVGSGADNRSPSLGIDKLADMHLGPVCADDPGQVTQALRVLQMNKPAVEADHPLAVDESELVVGQRC